MTLYDWQTVAQALQTYGVEGPMVDVGGIRNPELAAYEPSRLLRVPGDSLYGWACPDYEVVNPADGGGMPAEYLATLKPVSYRTVVCTGVIEHTVAPFAVAWALVGMLRVGGLLVVTVPWEWPRHGDPGGDYWRFSPDGLRQLFAPTDLICLDSGLVRCGGSKSIAWIAGSRGTLDTERLTVPDPPTPEEAP